MTTRALMVRSGSHRCSSSCCWKCSTQLGLLAHKPLTLRPLAHSDGEDFESVVSVLTEVFGQRETWAEVYRQGPPRPWVLPFTTGLAWGTVQIYGPNATLYVAYLGAPKSVHTCCCAHSCMCTAHSTDNVTSNVFNIDVPENASLVLDLMTPDSTNKSLLVQDNTTSNGVFALVSTFVRGGGLVCMCATG